jgi:hypothetical protein
MPPRSSSPPLSAILPPFNNVGVLAPASTTLLHDTVAPGSGTAAVGAYPSTTFFLSYYADHAGSVARDRLGYFSIMVSFNGVDYYEQKRIAIQQGVPRILGPFTVRTTDFRIEATSEQVADDIDLDWAISYDDATPVDHLADSSIVTDRPEVTQTFTTDVEENVVAFAMKSALGLPPAEDVSDPAIFTIPTFTDDPQEMHVIASATGTFNIYGRDSAGIDYILSSTAFVGAADTSINLDVVNGGGVTPFRFILCTWESAVAAATDVTVLMAFKK